MMVDPRDLTSGAVVSDRNGYYDSQNIVAVGDPLHPTFVCVLHHSENREGGPGLELSSTISTDGGRTWSALAPIDSPERQSHDGYQLVVIDQYGNERIVVFYGWNRGSQSAEVLKRTDMQLDEGYWYRISDDHGRSWGNQRWLLPVRRTAIDRENPWNGATMGMFLCDKPQVIDGAVYMAFQKTRDGAGETPDSEVFLLCSPDLIDAVRNHGPLDTVTWHTLPDGDRGLQSPEGDLHLGEEPHVMQVGDIPGRLHVLWRTEAGALAGSYSSDGGRHFEQPTMLPLRNPRGAITPFRLRTPAADGSCEYVMLFYNNARTDRLGYVGRRVYWLVAGRSTPAGTITWGQPEIALYWHGVGFENRPDWNPDWAIVDGPGYPDFAECADGSLCFVESNKLAVRFHRVAPDLLAALRHQPEARGVPDDAIALDWTGGSLPRGPVLVDLRSRGGFTITVVTDTLLPGQPVVTAFSHVTAALGEEPTSATVSKGWSITVTPQGTLELFVTDGFGPEVRLTASTVGRVVSFILDGAARVGSIVVDDVFDSGGERAQSWCFIPAELGEVGGADITHIAPDVRRLLVSDRAWRTTEAMAAARAL